MSEYFDCKEHNCRYIYYWCEYHIMYTGKEIFNEDTVIENS